MPSLNKPRNWRDDRGTTAIEFALVGPIFLLLLISTIYMSMMLFSIANLHLAVQQGARCASVQTTVCSDSASTIKYSQSHYFGVGASPTFIAAAAACGNSVTGTVSYVLPLGTTNLTVPISATACFP
jgi:Flp pilus assembly protein TadG